MRAMDIRLYGLLLIFAIVGSNADLYSSAYGRHRRDVERSVDRYELEDYDLVKIIKRAADSKETDDKIITESSEEKTILTTKSPGTTSPSTKSPGTTSPSTTSPSTTSPSTTKTTSSKPKSTKPTSTTSNAISSKPTTKSVPTSTETTTKPSTETTSKPQLGSRSAFDTKDDSPSNPTDSDEKADEKADKKPSALSPRMKADTSDNKDKSPSSPLTGSNPNGPSFNPGYSQSSNYPFPGINSIPPYGPNYAFTSTNNGPGMASASASSFASAGASSSSNPSNPPFNSYGSFNSPYYNPNEYAWPAYDASQNNPVKPMTSSRSYFTTDDKPKSPNNPATGNNGNPVNNPNSIPFSGPQNFPSRSFGGPYSPNFNYPPANGIQGPNYAWTDSGPGYAGASAGASYSSGLPMLNNRGAFSDNSAGTVFPDNSPYSPDVVAGGFQPGFDSGFDNGFSFHRRMMEDHFRRIQAQIEAQQRAIFDANNRIGGSSGFGPGSSEPGVHSAISSISVGPDGGFQAGQISPVAPGIESRFANPLPAPSGGSYGVFSSSRSVSSTDDTGRTVAHKSATTGVNDNGRITFRTVQD